MGYIVAEDSGVICIALRTGDGHVIAYHVTDEEVIWGENVIERIVSSINQLIV